MSLLKPIRPYHFQTPVIWWDGPFKGDMGFKAKYRSWLDYIQPELEFLNALKCNLAESASTGFQFNGFNIFNDKTFN